MNLESPLAELLRPENLDDYIGQEHIVGKGAILRRAIDSGNIPSMILWGPPGVGKTTLASIISHQLMRPFFTLSAINSGVKDVREVISKAQQYGNRAILFIDEIHRFSKSQQDSLLGAVEKGTVTLIGATTENPSFEVISALLSRCQVYILKQLDKDNMMSILKKGCEYLSQKLTKEVMIEEAEALIRISGGDARKLYNALELVVVTEQERGEQLCINNEMVQKIIQEKLVMFDKSGEMHYDVISAFIKSIRGSDPNAALYYLARMIEAGEDPKFIARRLLISASEDIGNANPNALLLAQSCFDSVNVIGYPECRIILSQVTVYLASSPKSNASYLAIKKAQDLVRRTGDLPVPLNIRNAPTKLMKEIGYGDGYKYSHDFPGNFAEQEFMPDAVRGAKIYDPGDNPREKDMRNRLKTMWNGKYNY